VEWVCEYRLRLLKRGDPSGKTSFYFLAFVGYLHNTFSFLYVAKCFVLCLRMCRASVFLVFGGRQVSVGVFICGVSGPCSSPNSKQNGIGSSCSLLLTLFFGLLVGLLIK